MIYYLTVLYHVVILLLLHLLVVIYYYIFFNSFFVCCVWLFCFLVVMVAFLFQPIPSPRCLASVVVEKSTRLIQ